MDLGKLKLTYCGSDNQASPRAPAADTDVGPKNPQPTDITKADVQNMGGSLKVHIRLNLEVDVRVIAKVKGDIAIGIL